MRFQWPVYVALLLMCAANGSSQSGSKADEVKRAEEEYRTAVLRNDASYFERHLSADYVGVDSDGTVSNASQLLAARKAGDYRVREIAVVNQSVHISGDTAVISECMKVEALKKDTKIPSNVQVLRVWREINGKWLVLALQVTPRSAPCNK
jgi:ketosteroid isomerase-like protein